MKNKHFEEIVTESVKYYENSFMSPEFTEQTTRASVIDCSGYFYAYGVKLMQNFFKKNRNEAEQSVSRLLTMTEESLTENLKMSIISDYNMVYMSLLDHFKTGLDHGEDSMEGFKIMLDSCAKIITCSIYWIENK